VRRGPVLAAVLLAAGAGAGCGHPAPRALVLGEDACAHCHMTLADPRFSAELVTMTGRTIPFDDVGCMGTFVATGGVPAEDIHSVWVSDYLRGDSLLAADTAMFLATDSIRTPMHYGIIALAPGAGADSLRAALGGVVLTWEQVVERLTTRTATTRSA